MVVRCCPECGHEIAGRGRYCMFCGCDLRKTPRTAAPVQQGKDRHEENREPDERFREKLGTIRKAALVIVLALLAVAGVIWLACITVASPRTADPALRAGMSFEEAARAVERKGFVKDGGTVEKNGRTTQNYRSREVYGSTTVYSELEVEEGPKGKVSLKHYYHDISGTGENSWIFTLLKRKLTSLYGSPKHGDGVVGYYSWTDGDTHYMLYTLVNTICIDQWQQY